MEKRRKVSTSSGSRVGSVVLFGAGASAFGPGVLPHNPPLGGDLFAELARCFPDLWGAMSPQMAARFQPDFEAGMRYIWQRYPNAMQAAIPGIPAPYELMQTMALYFLQFHLDPEGPNHYSRFLRALDASENADAVRLATLNYENLLEFALNSLGKPRRVLRPHGAVDWWVEGPVVRIGSGWAVGAGFHGIGHRVVPIARTNILPRMQKEGKYPAMAIYMPSKATQMGQRKLLNHQWRFREAIARAARLAVVGVRPYESDEHIWGAIARFPGELLYIGDNTPFDKWRHQYRPVGRSRWIGPTFEGAIDELASLL